MAQLFYVEKQAFLSAASVYVSQRPDFLRCIYLQVLSNDNLKPQAKIHAAEDQTSQEVISAEIESAL